MKVFELANIIPSDTHRFTQSCGCMRGRLVGEKAKTHGMSVGRHRKFYRHWRSMFNRLLPTYRDAKSYVGITVCDEWKEFEQFKLDMFESWLAHEREHGGRQTSLDRVNVLGGYSKDNCRWATQTEQAQNKKGTVYILLNGNRVSLAKAAKENGVNIGTAYSRLKRGWEHEDVIIKGWGAGKRRSQNMIDYYKEKI